MMNPSSLVSKGPFAEMWSFPQGTADAGAVLWMRPGPGEMTPLGSSPGFADAGGGGHRDAASLEESTVTDQSGGIPSRRRRGEVAAPGAGGSEDESSRVVSTCSGNELQTESETKCPKAGGPRDENGEYKAEVEASSNINRLTDQVPKPSEAPKQDYIHVRARRGQATDSHSLAERARREKISEKMKILQDLVPGCNKVIGKALVLDEIINYVQSLQRQVEFLSMKLEALSSHMNPDVEGFPAKDHDIQAFDTTSGFTFTSQPTRDYGQGSQQEWLHMQVGGGI